MSLLLPLCSAAKDSPSRKGATVWVSCPRAPGNGAGLGSLGPISQTHSKVRGADRGRKGRRRRCCLFQDSGYQDNCHVTHQVSLVTRRLSHHSSGTWQCLSATEIEHTGEETHHHMNIAVQDDWGRARFTLVQVEQPHALARQGSSQQRGWWASMNPPWGI